MKQNLGNIVRTLIMGAAVAATAACGATQPYATRTGLTGDNYIATIEESKDSRKVELKASSESDLALVIGYDTGKDGSYELGSMHYTEAGKSCYWGSPAGKRCSDSQLQQATTMMNNAAATLQN